MPLGCVYQRKDGRWCASLQVNGRRKTVYGKNEREARRKLAEMQSSTSSGNALPNPGRKTLNQLLDLWLQTSAPNLREGTLADYRDITNRHIRPRLGHVRLSNLHSEHLQSLYNDLSGKGRKRLPSLVHSLLHRALRFAVLWGWLASNPADRVIVPRHKPERKEVWNEEELRQFLDGTREHWLNPLWVVAVTTGCRIGELAALRWKDIDLRGNTLAVSGSLRKVKGEWIGELPKTESGQRAISLPAEAIAALRRQKGQQSKWHLKVGHCWQEKGLVFTTFKGEPLNRSTVEQAQGRECQNLGLRQLTPHQLRHLHASLLLSKGLPITAVSSRLGHANPSVTMSVYAHAMKRQDEEAAKVISDVLKVV